MKPWRGSDLKGTVYAIVIGTDIGGKDIKITYWVPNADQGKIYWCHGLTFGGDPAIPCPASDDLFSGGRGSGRAAKHSATR